VLASTLLRFDNRAIASVTVNQLAPRPLNDVVIHGSDGRIASRGLGSLAHLLRRPEGSSVTVEKVVGNHALQLHYDVAGVFERSVAAFSRAVLDGVEPNPSGADGLRSVQVMEAIAASAITGRTVSLTQTMAGR
jgi:predicted dehydrogenase